MSAQKLPENYDDARVHRVLDHYESQTDDAAAAEDQQAFESTTHTAMEVPVELVPQVLNLIAKRRTG